MISLKNKYKSLCFIAIVALGFLFACDPMYTWTKCPSYVVCYVDQADLHLSLISSSANCIVVNPGIDLSESGGLHSIGDRKEKYNYLCQKHHDLSYNGYRSIGGSLDHTSVTYGDCDFLEITVTSDKDFDAAHPIGANLSDIVRFMSWSPYKYILSGYSSYYHYDNTDVSEAFDTLMRIYINEKYFDNATEATCYPVDKLIKDLTTEDLILLGHDDPFLLGLLYFEKTPDVEGEYNITVSMKKDDGTVLSETIAMTF